MSLEESFLLRTETSYHLAPKDHCHHKYVVCLANLSTIIEIALILQP